MTDWFIYLLKSTLVFTLLYVPFLWMKSDTWHKRNRFYLLSIPFLSAIVPVLQFTTEINQNPINISLLLDTISVTTQKTTFEFQPWSFLHWLAFFSILVSTGILIFRTYQLSIIYLRIKKHKKNSDNNIIEVPGEKICYSALGYIFVSPDMRHTSALQHEFVHVNQKHAIDLFIYNFFVSLHWFNPFAWFALRSIKAQHEYEADKTIIQSTGNKNEYQALLLSSALGCDVHVLTHSFSSPTLKNRFIMMTKKQSSKWVSLKTLLIIPFLAIAVLAFSTTQTQGTSEKSMKEKEATKNKPVNKKTVVPAATAEVTVSDGSIRRDNTEVADDVEDLTVTTAIPDMPSTRIVDEMTQPEFPGGNDAFIKYMSENMKYPEAAKTDKISGKVYVEFTVKEDGSIANVSVRKSLRDDCDKEAVRVISAMPKWKPAIKNGKAAVASLILPISFSPN